MKKKGQFGYDSWQQLISKKDKKSKAAAEADPASSINDLMKQMYEDGDDNMRKAIGEAMLASRQKTRPGQSSAMAEDSYSY